MTVGDRGRPQGAIQHPGEAHAGALDLPANHLESGGAVSLIESDGAGSVRGRQRAVHPGAGEVEGLARPIAGPPRPPGAGGGGVCVVGGRHGPRPPGAPGGGLGGRQITEQPGGDDLRIGAQAGHEHRVPIMMQVPRRRSDGRHPHCVAALVMVIGGMQRLMQVAEQMQQELQREQSFVRVGSRRGEFPFELLELVEDAILRGARRGRSCRRRLRRTGDRRVGGIDLEVHVVPGAGAAIMALIGAAIGVAELVRPGGLGGDGVIDGERAVVRGEQVRDPLAYGRLQILLGDERDDLMPLVAEAARGRRQRDPCQGDAQAKSDQRRRAAAGRREAGRWSGCNCWHRRGRSRSGRIRG